MERGNILHGKHSASAKMGLTAIVSICLCVVLLIHLCPVLVECKHKKDKVLYVQKIHSSGRYGGQQAGAYNIDMPDINV